uniref:ribosome recycling factor n=1 Tax=Ndongobacter massiliensis TaxID=1871025 RepID=UPI000931EA4C|nr:ribosome recycling factor [Ndongobacter massiliensis]
MYNTKEMERRMNKSVESFEDELASIRAGRANPKVLEGITFPYYGVDTPINQAASISVPEARLLVIAPWDVSNIKPIEKAILASDLGITPGNDGKVIRLPFPELTGERRKELVKGVGGRAEEARIAIRNIRREAMAEIKKQEKSGELTEDERFQSEEAVQKITDRVIASIDAIAKEKEKELMAI